MKPQSIVKRIGWCSIALAYLWTVRFAVDATAQDADVSKSLRGGETAAGETAAVETAAVISVAGANVASRIAWQAEGFKYRIPVQVKNGGEAATSAQIVRLELPLPVWAQSGKLRADHTDLHLVDAAGQVVEVQIAPSALGFVAPALAAKSRAVFYLYYNNATATGAKQGAVPDKNSAALTVSAGAEEAQAGAVTRFDAGLEAWRKTHKVEEFAGQVWVRFKIERPQNYRYNIVIDSETNPYSIIRFATGTVSYGGLQPRPYEGDSDWGKPVAWIPPLDDQDWLRDGEYSAWAPLPMSKADYFHSAFIVKTSDDAMSKKITLHLEFATQPSPDAIFHVVDEATNEAGVALVTMPTQGGLKGLKMVEGFGEAARRRQRQVAALKLSAPPRLQKLRIGTWASLGYYRAYAGNANPTVAAPDFANFEALGINSASVDGLGDAAFAELARKHGIVDTTLKLWAGSHFYTHEQRNGTYDFKPDETPQARWQRIFNQFYKDAAQQSRRVAPFSTSIATHLNLADEPQTYLTAADILKTPQILQDFRLWLQAKKVQPADLVEGAIGWDKIMPTDDRKPLATADARGARLFYLTRRYLDHYSAVYYRAATDALRANFPKAELIAVNYQAGPIQSGFIGNSNDTDNGEFDLFELSRRKAMQGVMMEDWTSGWDLGIARIGLGAAMMRSAARKHDLPMASYIVGGGSLRAKFFAYLMNGVKENGLYLYGPVGNIGPAWADDVTEAAPQLADVTRQIKPLEELIAAAKVRPAKAALLIATTSDIMQKHGLYYGAERQNLYAALQHSNLPIDVVSEQDIAEDDLLKNYAVLYLSDPQVSSGVQRKIAAWIQGGGRLWAEAGAASWDETNRASTILDAAFGLTDRQVQLQDGGIAGSRGSWTHWPSKFAFKPMGALKSSHALFGGALALLIWGMKLTGRATTAQVIGNYDDGSPAIWSNRFGKGETILVGALVGEAYVRLRYPEEKLPSWSIPNWKLPADWQRASGAAARQLVSGLANRAAIVRPVLPSVAGVYTSVMDAPGATLVFLNNATAYPLQKVTVRLRGLGKAREIRSSRAGKVPFQVRKDGIVLEIPLANTDILTIRP